MSYGMVGSGRFSSRLHRIKMIQLDHLDLLQRTSRNDPKFARRLKMKHRLDKIYSEIYYRINSGQLSPDLPNYNPFQKEK